MRGEVSSPTYVAAPQRHAVKIEEPETLDRDLARVVEPVAEQRR